MNTHTHLLKLMLVVGLFLSASTGIVLAQEGPAGIPEDSGAALQIPAQAQLQDRELATTPVHNQAFSGVPAYDSGWVALAPDEAKTLVHNLGSTPDDYVVIMEFRAATVDGVNLRYYGGVDFGTNPAPGHAVDDRVGAYWRSLDETSITVYRRPEDSYAPEVRIRIWIDPHPNYDSGWIALTTNVAVTLNHNLSGNAEDYVVDLQYRSGGVDGINQRYFGGADFGVNPAPGHAMDDRVGTYWRSLDNTSITLFRRVEDTYSPEARLRIWVRPAPAYDSGWVPLALDAAQTLAHNLGGNSDNYVVDMQYSASTVDGVNQRYFGGADFGAKPTSGHNPDDRVGAYWRSLDTASIIIYRRPEDTYADQVRIRIWQYETDFSTAYWNPTAPDYDSGWLALAPGAAATTLSHNLGGSSDDYLVDMQYRTPDVNGINLRYFGGADFGANPAPGHAADERVGAYWRSLTNTQITLFRRDEDDYAPEVRVRIWVMPSPAYDTGWEAFAPDSSQTFAHNLGANPDDYLVDMQFRASSVDGVNQRYYGGMDLGAKTTVGAVDDRVGAYWRSLNASAITAYRRPEDTYADEIRLRIWRVAPPEYDSGWVALAGDDSATLAYDLSGSADSLLVNMLQYDGGGANGINHRHLGGADFGAKITVGAENDRVGSYWRSLSPQEVVVYRRPEDYYAAYVRMRIWDYRHEVYLPAISNNQ